MQGKIQGTTHLCQGQEAVSVGAVGALAERDYLTITYRGHGHALARGMSMVAAFGELMGRTSGCCNGVGGSMHLTDFSKNLIGAFAIIGAGLPVAVGAGLSAKMRGTDSVALSFSGDGGSNIGTFHEALNMAAVWKVPVVFVIENNLYGEYSPLRETTPLDDLAERAKALRDPRRDRRRPGRRRRPRDRCRARSRVRVPATGRRSSRRRPTATAAIRAPTRRSTAPRASSTAGSERDPIDILGDRLGLSEERAQDPARRRPGRGRRGRRSRRSRRRFRLSRRSRTMSTQLESKPAGVETDAAELTYREAINAALEDELESDPTVDPDGRGRRDGRRRLQDERGALRQVRPRARAQHADLRERLRRRRARDGGDGHAAGRSRSCSATSCRPRATRSSTSCRSSASCRGGQCEVPVTVRSIGGATGRFGTQHSATGESWYIGLPGLKVATAGTPDSAYACCARRSAANDPVLFFEHRGLYGRKGPVRRGDDNIAPVGAAAVAARRLRRNDRRDAADARPRARRGRAARRRRHRRGGRSSSAGCGRSTRTPCGRASRRPGGSSSPRSRCTSPAGARR